MHESRHLYRIPLPILASDSCRNFSLVATSNNWSGIDIVAVLGILLASQYKVFGVFDNQVVPIKVVRNMIGVVGGWGYSGPPGPEFTSARPEWITKIPIGLSNPEYAFLKFDGKNYTFLLEKTGPHSSRLWFDSNGDGDLTNDPAPNWGAKQVTARGPGNPNQTSIVWIQEGTAPIQFDLGGQAAKFNLSFDLFTEPLGAHRDYMSWSCMDGLGGEVQFGSVKFPFYLFDPLLRSLGTLQTDSITLGIDRTFSGTAMQSSETFYEATPVNIGGFEYELINIDLKKGNATFVPSYEPTEEWPLRPNWKVGDRAIPFATKSIAGNTIFFPEDFGGKLVLLYFWNAMDTAIARKILNAYGKYHKQGFDALGISVEGPNVLDEIKSYIKVCHVTWPLVYPGVQHNYIAKQYGADDPFLTWFLVDGSSRKVVSFGSLNDHGELEKAIDTAMKSLH